MSDHNELTIAASEISSEAPQQLAMVYRNEFNEVSHVTQDGSAMAVHGGFANIVLVFVFSLVALVTISRRSSSN